MSDRTWRSHPLVQLTLLRVREFIREPEAVFWAVAFPGDHLGRIWAWRFATSPRRSVRDRLDVRRASSPPSAPTSSWSLCCSRRSRRRRPCGPARCCSSWSRRQMAACRIGTTTRIPRRGRRARSSIAPCRWRAAASIPCRSKTIWSAKPGSRYIDFVVPGLVGMGIMGNALWHLGFSIVDARRRKLMKRLVGDADVEALLPGVVPGLAHGAARDRSRRARRDSASSRSVCPCAARCSSWPRLRRSGRWRSAPSPSWSRRGRGPSRASPAS